MHNCNEFTYLPEQICIHEIWETIDVNKLLETKLKETINVQGKKMILEEDFTGKIVRYKEKFWTFVPRPKLIHFISFEYKEDKLIYGVEEFENEVKTHFHFPIYYYKQERKKIISRYEIFDFFNSEADTITEESFSFLSEEKYNNSKLTTLNKMKEQDNFDNLTANYEYYYDNELKSVHLLNLNQERKTFNRIFGEFLINNEKLLCITGPYGIGKTTSLLYCQRMNYSHKILYFNLKKMRILFEDKTDKKNNIMKISMNEIIRISDSYIEFSNLISFLEKCYHTANNIWSFLVLLCTDIINYCKNNNAKIMIIFDQYKQKYDEYYTNIKKLLELNTNNTLKIIISSSINDSDTGLTIKSEWLNENNTIIHYRLFNSLIDNHIITNKENLSEELKQILEQFNYLPRIYYELIEKNIVNKNQINDFLSDKKDHIRDKIQAFYRNNYSNMFWGIQSIKSNIGKLLEKSEFLKLIEYIPLKYITVKEKEDCFILNYHFPLIQSVFEEIYFNLSKLNTIYPKKENKVIYISGEDFEFLITQVIKTEGFNSYKIERIIEVNSVIDLLEKNDNIIKEKKAISELEIKDYHFSEKLCKNTLFIQTSNIAKRYDLAILIYTQGKYKFYLLQVTKYKTVGNLLFKNTIKKDCKSISFILKKKYNVEVEESEFYFFYIFLEENKNAICFNALTNRGIAWLTYSTNNNRFIDNDYNSTDAHVFNQSKLEERSRGYQSMNNIRSSYYELKEKKEKVKKDVEPNEEYYVSLSNKDIEEMKKSIANYFLINIQRIKYYDNINAIPRLFLPSEKDEVIIINELCDKSQFILREKEEFNLEEDEWYNCKEGITTIDNTFKLFYEMTTKNRIVRYYFFTIEKPNKLFKFE